MKVLIACEESQRVCIEMRKLGHEAYSCDLLPAGGGKPEWHIQDDCLKYINGASTFTTQDGQTHVWGGGKINKWDLIVAHPPCFVAGTKVITYDGIKNIEDVQVGDFVLTHNGRYKRVYQTMNHTASNLIDIQIENCGHVICTENHQFYTSRIQRYGRGRRILFGDFEWLSPLNFNERRNTSGEIKEKTYIASICDDIYEDCHWDGIEKFTNKYCSKHVNTLPINDPNFWYIIGRWVGDGVIYRKKENGVRKLRGIAICCSIKETDYLQRKINMAGFHSTPTSKGPVNMFFIYGKELAAFCLQFGEHAENKYVPGFVSRLHHKFVYSFLDGYFDSDGHRGIPNRISYSSVSSNLAYGIKYLVNKYYKRPCSITKNDNSKRKEIMGRICNIKDSYTGQFLISEVKQERSIKYNDYILSPYHKIIKLNGEEIVYNLSVEDDESYTANGVIVHNCTLLCVTGNKWFNVEKYGDKAIQRQADRELAVEFFMKCVNADCDKIAIENPVGIMSTLYRKPDQIIQPWMFGDRARKKTCLWLKNLSLLVPTDIVDEGEIGNFGLSKSAGAYFCRDENGKILRYNDPLTAKIRSRTFPGIARAFAEQWCGECEDDL